ncbi:hypothetical protein [Pseudarthrobacter sp. PvP090]|uniref:hypothetical protein n=1 Tax=Pseudarthrobacter sp. PvP090 TaxID=3156393 RepID=UPI003398CC29
MSPEAKEPEPNQPGPDAPEEAAPPPATEPGTGPAAGPRRPDRTLLAILAAIAVIVVVALIVVFTRGEPAPVDEATPAGVVQRYSAAVIAGDETAAAAYLTDAAKNRCSTTMERMPGDNLRVTLVSTTERPASADVKVLITVSEGGGPFGSAEYQIEDGFDLVKTGDRWLIDRAPWQLTVCQNAAVK